MAGGGQGASASQAGGAGAPQMNPGSNWGGGGQSQSPTSPPTQQPLSYLQALQGNATPSMAATPPPQMPSGYGQEGMMPYMAPRPMQGQQNFATPQAIPHSMHSAPSTMPPAQMPIQEQAFTPQMDPRRHQHPTMSPRVSDLMPSVNPSGIQGNPNAMPVQRRHNRGG